MPFDPLCAQLNNNGFSETLENNSLWFTICLDSDYLWIIKSLSCYDPGCGSVLLGGWGWSAPCLPPLGFPLHPFSFAWGVGGGLEALFNALEEERMGKRGDRSWLIEGFELVSEC